MKKVKRIFLSVWNDTEYPKDEWNSYFEFKKKNPGSDPLPPLTGRGHVMVVVFVILFIISLIIFSKHFS